MAVIVTWSDDAISDIEHLAQTISRDSLYYARQVVDTLYHKAGSLDEHPKRGRVVPELNNAAIREIFIYSYRLIYEVSETGVDILAVIHGKQLLESVGRFTS